MTSLVKKQTASLPVIAPIPARSPKLAAFMNEWGNTPSHFVSAPPWNEERWFLTKMPDASIIAEAQRIASAFEAALAPAGEGVVRAWLLPIAAGVGNPPSAGDFAARAAAIAMACAKMPSCAFTEASQREALCSFNFWPSAAEVHNLLAEYADPVRRRYRDVVRVARARPMSELPAARKAYDARHPDDCYPCDSSFTRMPGSF